MRIVRAFTQNRAATEPEADDPRLRGRSYAVPFVQVWEAALQTAERLRWTVLESDPRAGTFAAEARTRLWRFTDDVWVRVSLDEDDGGTRVDLVSASRKGGGDLGTNARRIARFLHALDRRLLGGKRTQRQQ